MKKRESSPEQISALMDGELNYLSVEAALTSLKQGSAESTWDVYHHIGDVLRFDRDADSSSQAFMKRFSSRLDEEKPHEKPARIIIDIPAKQRARPLSGHQRFAPRFHAARRFALPGAAAVAAAFIAFLSVPALTTVDSGNDARLPTTSSSAAGIVTADTDGKRVPAKLADSVPSLSAPAAKIPPQDSQLDGHLLHDQTSSPSFYSAAQHPASSAFSSDPAK